MIKTIELNNLKSNNTISICDVKGETNFHYDFTAVEVYFNDSQIPQYSKFAHKFFYEIQKNFFVFDILIPQNLEKVKIILSGNYDLEKLSAFAFNRIKV